MRIDTSEEYGLCLSLFLPLIDHSLLHLKHDPNSDKGISFNSYIIVNFIQARFFPSVQTNLFNSFADVNKLYNSDLPRKRFRAFSNLHEQTFEVNLSNLFYKYQYTTNSSRKCIEIFYKLKIHHNYEVKS